MRERIIIIIVALFFGVAAAFMVTNYANQAKQAALEMTKPTQVYVAADDIPFVGQTMDELKQKKLIHLKQMPKDFVASGALTPANDPGDQVLAVALSRGEQLTGRKFKVSKSAGLSFTIPEDKVAVAIPIDDMKAAGNLIKVGDLVNVVGTSKLPDEDKFMTKTILQKVQVLAVGQSLENAEPSGGGAAAAVQGNQQRVSRTATLALTQADSEKLIFMQDQGHIWLTLLPSKKAEAVTTGGQTVQTVFK